MGREVEEAQAHLAQSSEHPPVTSTFKSTEFPGARVTPEGQTTAGRRDGGTAEEKLRAVQDPGCAERLREWAPVAAGCERVTRPAPWRPAGGLKGRLLYVLYTFVTREIHSSYFSTFLLLGFRGWAGRGGGDRGKEVESLANRVLFPLVLPGWMQTGGPNAPAPRSI